VRLRPTSWGDSNFVASNPLVSSSYRDDPNDEHALQRCVRHIVLRSGTRRPSVRLSHCRRSYPNHGFFSYCRTICRRTFRGGSNSSLDYNALGSRADQHCAKPRCRDEGSHHHIWRLQTPQDGAKQMGAELHNRWSKGWSRQSAVANVFVGQARARRGLEESQRAEGGLSGRISTGLCRSR